LSVTGCQDKSRDQIERDLEMAGGTSNIPEMKRRMILTGHGICNNGEFHKDIAFYYEVISDSESKEIIIKCYQSEHPIPEKKEEFNLISSEKVKIP